MRRRPYAPAHHAIGPIEAELEHVKSIMQRRSFCFRNQERTNRLLELIRLNRNKLDDPIAYARSIRHHLDHTGGLLPRQGAIRDPLGYPSLR